MRISDWSSDVCSSDLEHLDGTFTLGENIGDLAGLTIAYDAYKKALGGKEAPVIDGTTGDQRFFLGWAQVWRRNYREQNLSQRITTDLHSRSEEHTSELPSLMRTSSAGFCLNNNTPQHTITMR